MFRLALLPAAILLAACAAAVPATQAEREADLCRMYRGYTSTQEPQNVMEACTRELGEASCRQCLNR